MNEEHVEIVKSGQIDEWRTDNPGARLDLSGADLSGADLFRANLREADLSAANLSGSDLSDANLSGSDLSGANLSGAALFDADLTGADLSGANLSGATMLEAKLIQANLSGSDLSGANLSGAALYDSDLTKADLSGANLFEADMFATNLTDATLYDADFLLASLVSANLTGANLSYANLKGTILMRADLTGANLTGAKLFGSARDGWKIEGVICDYVFWDDAHRERSPKTRDLVPGEFEQLYAQLPTIEYVFENGLTPLDPVIMDLIVQAINERTPEFHLQIDSINTRGIRPTITFNVRYEEQKEEVLGTIAIEYGLMNAKLQGRGEAFREVISEFIDRTGNAPINIGPGSVVALDSATINMEDYIGHLEEIREAIKSVPAEELSDSDRSDALDAVTDGIKDIALGKVKEAAKGVTERITQLGIDLATKTRGFEALADLVD